MSTRQQYVGFIRAVRGARLTGNRTVIESDASTRTEAETWLSEMLASNVEAGSKIAEAGTRKYDPKTNARRTRQTGKNAKETGHSAENKTENDAQNNTQNRAPKKPGRGHRPRSAHGAADHPARARANAKT